MQQKVEPSPLPIDHLENSLHLSVGLDVQRHEDRSLQFCHNRRNKGFGLLMTIGDRQLRTCSPEGGAASCSNGMFVCNADNKPAFALQKIFQHVCYS